MLDDHTTTIVCKVNGGLSTTRHRPDFVATFKFCAFIKLLAEDSSTLTFKENLSRADNHLTRPTIF
jgi:hypothetical protein